LGLYAFVVSFYDPSLFELLSSEHPELLNFDFDADPEPAFGFDEDPDPQRTLVNYDILQPENNQFLLSTLESVDSSDLHFIQPRSFPNQAPKSGTKSSNLVRIRTSQKIKMPRQKQGNRNTKKLRTYSRW
jgi:hypothetical protein